MRSRADQIRDDPAIFRRWLKVETNHGPKPLADVLDPWQREDFTALDPAWRRLAGQAIEAPRNRAWLERPRGHSKTNDIAVMVAWAIGLSPRRLSGIAAAKDIDQANLLRDAVSRLVSLNSWLAGELDVQRQRIVNRRTDSELKIITSDAPGSYGHTPHFIVCDELTHWTKPDLWESLISSAAKRADCLLVCILNAGYGDSWQARIRQQIEHDQAWWFHALDGPQASWISQKQLDEQKRLLPAIAYQRLWLNRWTAGAGDALSEAEIRDAVSPVSAPRAASDKGFYFVAGVDLGLKRDASAIAIVGRHVGHAEQQPAAERPVLHEAVRSMVDLGILDRPLSDEPTTVYHPGTGRLECVGVHIFDPPGGGNAIDLESVERCILEAHAKYRLRAVACDPWQAAYLCERLVKAGLHVEPVDPTGQNLKGICSAVLESFAERSVTIPQDARLLADLRALRVVEKSYGVRLESPRGVSGGTRHGDTASALGIAMMVARRLRPLPVVHGTLVCYP